MRRAAPHDRPIEGGAKRRGHVLEGPLALVAKHEWRLRQPRPRIHRLRLIGAAVGGKDVEKAIEIVVEEKYCPRYVKQARPSDGRAGRHVDKHRAVAVAIEAKHFVQEVT